MKKLIAILLVIMFVLTMSCGNAVGDENYHDHSSDGSQPGSGDVGPGEPDDHIDPAEDRTRHKDA